MKTIKKHVKTEAEARAMKGRERPVAEAVFLAFILFVVVFSAYFNYNFLGQPQNQTTNQASSQPKAAIVDQLSLTCPNQAFIETATNTLKEAHYTVDYYSAQKVTVEFYRNLLVPHYKLIILRVHTSQHETFMTSQPYDTSSYLWEQCYDQVWKVAYTKEARDFYFGISSSFVTSRMNGELAGSLVIAMGCNSISKGDMAKAFIERGAKAYVGWTGPVSAEDTDAATTQLLRRFFIEGQTLGRAVEKTAEETGLASSYESQLRYYPSDADKLTMENITKSG
jgi:hypothetical protein